MKKEVVQKIVKATGVTVGELVLVHFWGDDSDKEIANQFMAAVAAEGATPFLLQQSRSVNRDIFSVAKPECFDERYYNMLSSFDAVLDVFAYQPIILGYELEKEQQDLYRRYIATIFGEFMKCKRFSQIRIPTMANAEESELEPEDFIKRMEAAYDVDYDKLQRACQSEIEKYKDAKKVVIHTGENCQLERELGNRSWNMDAGDGDMPCGEIYIAPVEEKTNGTIFFD